MIHGYKETKQSLKALIGTPMAHALPALREIQPPRSIRRMQPQAHVLQLARYGRIDGHVDAVKFCGHTVAGVCLGSDAVMRLELDESTILDTPEAR